MTDTEQGDRVPFRDVQYRTATGNGQLWSRPTRLFFAELEAHTAEQHCVLYDHTRFPQNMITALGATPLAKSETFPPKPVMVAIERGVYVSYSTTWFTGPVTIGFNP